MRTPARRPTPPPRRTPGRSPVSARRVWSAPTSTTSPLRARATKATSPPSAPFSLRAVEYELHHFSLFADRCLALPHQLLVFRVASDAPTPARPRYDLDIRVTPEAPTPLPDENTTVTHRETFAPIRIGEGEDVVVAISMEGRTFDDGTAELVCLSAVSCSDWEADEHLWSNAAAPPFDWATLASFENRTSYQIALFGLPE